MPKLPTVTDYMVVNVRTISPDMDIRRAVRILLGMRISGCPVVDEKNMPIGVLTEKDCLRLLAKGKLNAEIPAGTVADYMTAQVTTIPADMDIYYAAGMFLRHVYRRFPVVDKSGEIVGILSRSDLLRAVDHHFDDAKIYSSGKPAPPREHSNKG